MVEKSSELFFVSVWNSMMTMNRLKGSNNYQSWANPIKLWFTRHGVEDHLTSTKSSVVEDKRS